MTDDELDVLEEQLHNLCIEIMESEERSKFITTSNAHTHLKNNWTERTKRTLTQSIGLVLGRVDYTDQWSNFTYEILPEEL